MIKTLRVLLMVLVVLSIFACGQSQNPSQPVPPTQDSSGGQPPPPQNPGGTGQPKLEVHKHGFRPATLKVGEAGTFWMTIRNTGDGAAADIQWAIFPTYEENNPSQHLLSGTIDRLEPGAETMVEGEYTYWQADSYPVRYVPNINQPTGPDNTPQQITVTVQ